MGFGILKINNMSAKSEIKICHTTVFQEISLLGVKQLRK
jgi:hypothetical protein